MAKKEGAYELFCTEYCGLSHSYMFTEVKAMPQAEFDAWYIKMADTTRKSEPVADPVAEGKRLMEKNGCVVCHSSDGTKIVGPTYKGVYGHKLTVVTDGKEREIVADDEYIKRSIYEPDADIVKGYTKGMMVSYKAQLSNEDVANIIEYLKSIK